MKHLFKGMLLSLLLSQAALTGCASRQERLQLESGDFGLVLLDQQVTRPLEQELDQLFGGTSAQLGALPPQVRGWLSPLAPALDQLHRFTRELAIQRSEQFQQALAPFRTVARYPIVYEQVKVPADQELAPVVIQANQQLLQAWRSAGALWLAAGLEPLLQQELYRIQNRDQDSRAALGVASVSQIYLLLQAKQTADGLAARLEESQRLASLRQEVLRARLRSQPGLSRILADDIQLLSALNQSLLRARTDLFESSQRLETLLLKSGDRIEDLAKALV